MSKKKDHCFEEKNTFLGGLGNCCCDFPTLIILILIILQFNRRGNYGGIAPVAAAAADECGSPVVAAPSYFGGINLIDNSILFIIALFFLSCCNPCRK